MLNAQLNAHTILYLYHFDKTQEGKEELNSVELSVAHTEREWVSQFDMKMIRIGTSPLWAGVCFWLVQCFAC